MKQSVKNIQLLQEQHAMAMSALMHLESCIENKDAMGAEYCQQVYAQTMQQLTEPHMKKALQGFFTNEQTEYILNDGPKPQTEPDGIGGELLINPNGILVYKTENE